MATIMQSTDPILDLAQNLTTSLCPSYSSRTNSTLTQIYDRQLFSDPPQLAEIACESIRLIDFKQYIRVSVQNNIVIVQAILGIISVLLALLAYSLKGFRKTPAFNYYRAINFFDLFFAGYNICIGFQLSTPWLEGNISVSFIGCVCAKSSHLLVLWTAIDRALACRSIAQYKIFDKNITTFKIILGVFLLSVFYQSIIFGFQIRELFYGISQPAMALAIFDRVWRAWEGITMLICTALVIRGLRDMSRRKKKLLQSTTNANRELLAQIKINQTLCFLQLCEGIPFIFVSIFDYACFMTNFLVAERADLNPFASDSTYEENRRHQILFRVQTYMEVGLTLSDFYGHSCHFFTYMAFSPKFRSTVLAFVRGKATSVVSTTQSANNRS